MQTWTQLSRLALIGTEQQAPAPVTLGDPDLDGAFAKLGSPEQRELYALSAGAALTLARRAGHKPGLTTHAVSPAPPETQPRCPEAAGQALARMLGDYLPQVLPEWLDLAGTLGFRAPEELLPELLDQAKTTRALRPAVKRVLGQRGAWLAAQNPDWSFAIRVNDSEKAWQEGRRPERVAALDEIRQADPARARDLLTATWKDEPPEDRAEFIQVLATGLSIEDEPFLEAALDDKRKEVRANAVRLLGSLPASKLVRRITELATPFVQIKRHLLRGASMEISLPAECTKEMSRYGIGTTKPPSKEIGEKAWWLEEMLEVIPPSHWNKTTGLAPKELIVAALKSEWARPLLFGWSQAAGWHKDSAWTTAWLELALEKEDLLDYLPRLIPDGASAQDHLPVISRILRKHMGWELHRHLNARLHALPRPWNKDFSEAILKQLHAGLKLAPTDYLERGIWENLMKAAALGFAPDFTNATTSWPKEITQDKAREVIDEFCAVIEFRRAIHRHFKGES